MIQEHTEQRANRRRSRGIESPKAGHDIYVGKNNKAFQASLGASTSEGRSPRRKPSEKGMRNKGKVKNKEGNRRRNTKRTNFQN